MKRFEANPYELMWGAGRDVQMAAQREILAGARSKGIKVPQSRTGGFGQQAEVFLGWEKLFGIAQQTGAAGGRILPTPDAAAMDRNTAAIDKNTKALLGELPVGHAPAPVGAPAPAARLANVQVPLPIPNNIIPPGGRH